MWRWPWWSTTSHGAEHAPRMGGLEDDPDWRVSFSWRGADFCSRHLTWPAALAFGVTPANHFVPSCSSFCVQTPSSCYLETKNTQHENLDDDLAMADHGGHDDGADARMTSRNGPTRRAPHPHQFRRVLWHTGVLQSANNQQVKFNVDDIVYRMTRDPHSGPSKYLDDVPLRQHHAGVERAGLPRMGGALHHGHHGPKWG